MKKMFMAVIALMMTISTSAQFYIYYSDGTIAKVDSISMIDPKVHNGHEYVDLGLSVKWATCNVGANKPEEYGDYFAWGEVAPKSDYSEDNYKWGYIEYIYDEDGVPLARQLICIKYNSAVDDILEKEDDAASVNWGEDWRMPTWEEITELIDNCVWEMISKNGVKGYKVTSKSNGNSIFLPAAGYRFESSLLYDGNEGYYWSSSLYTDDVSPYPTGVSPDSYSLNFYENFVDRYNRGDYRVAGHSVRPVCP